MTTIPELGRNSFQLGIECGKVCGIKKKSCLRSPRRRPIFCAASKDRKRESEERWDSLLEDGRRISTKGLSLSLAVSAP